MQQAHNGRANECSLSLTGTSGFGEPARTKGALQRSTGGCGGGCLWKCFRHPPLKGKGGGAWKHQCFDVVLRIESIEKHAFLYKRILFYFTLLTQNRARLQQPQRGVDPVLQAFVRWAEINQNCHQKAENCAEGWEAGMFAADQSLHNKDARANTPAIRSWCLTLSPPPLTAL